MRFRGDGRGQEGGGGYPEPGRRWSLTLSIVAMGSGLRKATDSAFSADSTAKTVTVKVKMAFSRNVHECMPPSCPCRAAHPVALPVARAAQQPLPSFHRFVFSFHPITSSPRPPSFTRGRRDLRACISRPRKTFTKNPNGCSFGWSRFLLLKSLFPCLFPRGREPGCANIGNTTSCTYRYANRVCMHTMSMHIVILAYIPTV